MTRNRWLNLGPSLIVGAGIIVSTLIAVLAAKSGWLVMAGPVALALTIVGADMLDARRPGAAAGPSWSALLLACTTLLASAIVGFRDPKLIAAFIPIMGSTAWVTLLPRPERRCKAN